MTYTLLTAATLLVITLAIVFAVNVLARFVSTRITDFNGMTVTQERIFNVFVSPIISYLAFMIALWVTSAISFAVLSRFQPPTNPFLGAVFTAFYLLMPMCVAVIVLIKWFKCLSDRFAMTKLRMAIHSCVVVIAIAGTLSYLYVLANQHIEAHQRHRQAVTEQSPPKKSGK